MNSDFIPMVFRFRTDNIQTGSLGIMLVHAVCYGELYVHGDSAYCDICQRAVLKGEILVEDVSPS